MCPSQRARSSCPQDPAPAASAGAEAARKPGRPPRRTPPAKFLDRSARIRALAEPYRGDVRAGLDHLADLYQHCDRFYPDVPVPPSDGLPYLARRPVDWGSGSPAALCTEG